MSFLYRRVYTPQSFFFVNIKYEFNNVCLVFQYPNYLEVSRISSTEFYCRTENSWNFRIFTSNPLFLSVCLLMVLIVCCFVFVVSATHIVCMYKKSINISLCVSSAPKSGFAPNKKCPSNDASTKSIPHQFQ